jgi:hypothetical protein
MLRVPDLLDELQSFLRVHLHLKHSIGVWVKSSASLFERFMVAMDKLTVCGNVFTVFATRKMVPMMSMAAYLNCMSHGSIPLVHAQLKQG